MTDPDERRRFRRDQEAYEEHTWKFIEDNKDFFVKNPRLSLMIRALEKLEKDRKLRIFKAAEKFIEEKTL